MANIEQLVEQRCDEYRQRTAELEGQLSEGEQELRAAQATISQQAGVIAAMREALVKNAVYEEDHYFFCHHCGAQGEWTCDPTVVHKPDCIVVNADTAQLSADHDAAVRAPLEARIAKLEECDYWRNQRYDLLLQEQSRMRDPERRLLCDILANGQLWHDESRYAIPESQDPANIRADERKRVLEEAAQMVAEYIGLDQVADRIRALAAQPEERE